MGVAFALLMRTCRRERRNIVSRIIAALRFRRDVRRCGDFLLEDPPTDTFVREPRRPKPFQPGGAIALELPNSDHRR
jgi:hypothetical protein